MSQSADREEHRILFQFIEHLGWQMSLRFFFESIRISRNDELILLPIVRSLYGSFQYLIRTGACRRAHYTVRSARSFVHVSCELIYSLLCVVAALACGTDSAALPLHLRLLYALDMPVGAHFTSFLLKCKF